MDEAERLAFEGWASLPQFKKKVEQAKSIIVEALAIAPAYVAISWGKDSIAMLHLAQSISPDVLAIFWTDPEQENFGDYANVISKYLEKYKTTNYLELDVYGDRVPHKVNASRLWEQYPVAFIGLRLEEGGKRKFSLKKYGAIHKTQNQGYRVCPLIYWNWRDIWAYTVANDLPYLSAYDHPANGNKSTSRTCNLLAKGSKNIKGTAHGRIARLRAMNPEYYNYLRDNYPNIASLS